MQRFASSDLSVFLMDLLNDGDSVHSRENSVEIVGTPVKICLIWTGTQVRAWVKPMGPVGMFFLFESATRRTPRRWWEKRG